MCLTSPSTRLLASARWYIQEVKSAERRAQMRAKMEARYGSMLQSSAEPPRAGGTEEVSQVLELRDSRSN